jgi:hypothetical protein
MELQSMYVHQILNLNDKHMTRSRIGDFSDFSKRISGSLNDRVFSGTVIKNRGRQTNLGQTPVTTEWKMIENPGRMWSRMRHSSWLILGLHLLIRPERIMQKPGETRLGLRGKWRKIPFRITILTWEDCESGLIRAPETTTSLDYDIQIDLSQQREAVERKRD